MDFEEADLVKIDILLSRSPWMLCDHYPPDQAPPGNPAKMKEMIPGQQYRIAIKLPSARK